MCCCPQSGWAVAAWLAAWGPEHGRRRRVCEHLLQPVGRPPGVQRQEGSPVEGCRGWNFSASWAARAPKQWPRACMQRPSTDRAHSPGLQDCQHSGHIAQGVGEEEAYQRGRCGRRRLRRWVRR